MRRNLGKSWRLWFLESLSPSAAKSMLPEGAVRRSPNSEKKWPIDGVLSISVEWFVPDTGVRGNRSSMSPCRRNTLT